MTDDPKITPHVFTLESTPLRKSEETTQTLSKVSTTSTYNETGKSLNSSIASTPEISKNVEATPDTFKIDFISGLNGTGKNNVKVMSNSCTIGHTAIKTSTSSDKTNMKALTEETNHVREIKDISESNEGNSLTVNDSEGGLSMGN